MIIQTDKTNCVKHQSDVQNRITVCVNFFIKYLYNIITKSWVCTSYSRKHHWKNKISDHKMKTIMHARFKATIETNCYS